MSPLMTIFDVYAEALMLAMFALALFVLFAPLLTYARMLNGTPS